MRQIDQANFTAAIASMNNLKEFDALIKNRENRLSQFRTANKFQYKMTYSRKAAKKGQKIKYTKQLTYKIKKGDPFDQYLELLNKNLRNIIICDQDGLLKWKDDFDQIDFTKVVTNVKTAFFNKILTNLNYKGLRSGEDKLLFKFYSFLGVKACVYCNSQHVVLLKTSEKARLQADHSLPKKHYPCFSITLSNLYPSCNNCNHMKDEDVLDYFLYYSSSPHNEFKFELDPGEISKFMQNQIKEENLTIKFNQGKTQINSVLKIDEIYENHKDYVGDLLKKYRVYNDAYISRLTKSFDRMFGKNEKMLNRMIFGSTMDENDINQKVFSKLTMDIKAQLDQLNKKKSP